MMQTLKAQILDRFLDGPQAKKIAEQIESEREKERREITARLDKVTAERAAALVEPSKKLEQAKARLADFHPELARRAAALQHAQREQEKAARLHLQEIRDLQKKLQTLDSQVQPRHSRGADSANG